MYKSITSDVTAETIGTPSVNRESVLSQKSLHIPRRRRKITIKVQVSSWFLKQVQDDERRK